MKTLVLSSFLCFLSLFGLYGQGQVSQRWELTACDMAADAQGRLWVLAADGLSLFCYEGANLVWRFGENRFGPATSLSLARPLQPLLRYELRAKALVLDAQLNLRQTIDLQTWPEGTLLHYEAGSGLWWNLDPSQQFLRQYELGQSQHRVLQDLTTLLPKGFRAEGLRLWASEVLVWDSRLGLARFDLLGQFLGFLPWPETGNHFELGLSIHGLCIWRPKGSVYDYLPAQGPQAAQWQERFKTPAKTLQIVPSGPNSYFIRYKKQIEEQRL